MIKAANDIVNWIIQSGLLVWLFYFGFSVGKPFIDSKIKHAKTAQEKELWTLVQQASMTEVNSLVGKNIPGQEKFERAVAGVYSYLEAKGLHIDGKQIQSAVQAAYELSTLTPTVDPNAKANEANDAEKADSKQETVAAAGTVKAIDPKEVA
ncbi:phage holin, LLH family [Limosilactobacillus reuteri]|uniref:phage holin, LLH family n=1 Tax=Limosilactobacillus reuteri TaxID=1598 RepID=UPI001EE6F7DD|nr:phage holin, LLH family [Limosilactobacillus reuteri]